jgi:hypothetical protein
MDPLFPPALTDTEMWAALKTVGLSLAPILVTAIYLFWASRKK